MTKIDTTYETSGAAHLLLDGLEKCWRKYTGQLKICREEFSNEAVHDLRVATRRMMAIIRLLHAIAPHPRLQKIIRTLKKQLDEFDDLRDTQVILAEVSEAVQQLPKLLAFQKYEQRQELQLLREVRKQIRKFDTKVLTRRIRKTRDSIQASDNELLETEILQAVDDAFMIAKQRLELVDTNRPPTIHRVRIAFKTFRYMVEIIYPLLKEYPADLLKNMHDYQSLMGEVQDAEIFIQTLSEFSEHASTTDHGRICRYYEHRHTEAIAAYAQSMNHLHIFWRSGPSQPFPWEKPA